MTRAMATIQFLGAAQTVTGSMHLVSANGRRERSAAVAAPITNSDPNRAACLRKRSIRSGPRMPSGKPG